MTEEPAKGYTEMSLDAYETRMLTMLGGLKRQPQKGL